jgi:hypothetical protein
MSGRGRGGAAPAGKGTAVRATSRSEYRSREDPHAVSAGGRGPGSDSTIAAPSALPGLTHPRTERYESTGRGLARAARGGCRTGLLRWRNLQCGAVLPCGRRTTTRQDGRPPTPSNRPPETSIAGSGRRRRWWTPPGLPVCVVGIDNEERSVPRLCDSRVSRTLKEDGCRRSFIGGAVLEMEACWPSGVVLRGRAPNRPVLRWLKTVVVSDRGEGALDRVRWGPGRRSRKRPARSLRGGCALLRRR